MFTHIQHHSRLGLRSASEQPHPLSVWSRIPASFTFQGRASVFLSTAWQDPCDSQSSTLSAVAWHCLVGLVLRRSCFSYFSWSMGSVVFPAVCQVCLSSRLCFSDFWLDKHLVAAAIPPPRFIAQQRNARPKQRRKPLCQVVDSLLGTCAAGSER